MMTSTTTIQNTTRSHKNMMLALLAVGARVPASASVGFFRSRDARRRMMRWWAKVVRNMEGAMNRDSLPMFMRDTAATADARMIEDHRNWSIWRERAEKGWFSVTVIILSLRLDL